MKCDIISGGSVAEWLKAHDSKSCGRVNRLEGSNPFASAIFFCGIIGVDKEVQR